MGGQVDQHPHLLERGGGLHQLLDGGDGYDVEENAEREQTDAPVANHSDGRGKDDPHDHKEDGERGRVSVHEDDQAYVAVLG
jgi:hypothetical protein